jgi:hypothetical protein
MPFGSLLAAFMGAAAALLCGSATARADDLYAADGIDLRWDNTVRYSNAIRISPQSATLLASANADDGDRNFASGLVSDRLDLESQLDLALGNVGFHASAAGWYDTVYHNSTDNRSPATYNVTSVPASSFAPAVRNLEGQYAELDDAFVYGTFDIENIPVSARLGRQTVLWGESLFYDANSIASAQAPTDYTRTVTGQSSYSSNLYLPVTQLSLTAQLLPDVSLTVYDHLGARPSRQAGDGSYFSYVDFLGPGAGRFFLPSGQYLLRQDDGKVSVGGQYGAALHTSMDDTDFGFYVLQYNATDPQIIMTAYPGGLDPAMAGFYKLVYPKDIVLLGVSASTSLDDGTIAGELSLRRNVPLVAYPPGDEPMFDTGGSPFLDYLRGDLLHVQASAQMPVGKTDAWDSANLSMEMAADDVTGISGDATAASLERFAAKARLMFEPHYFQVLPNLDLTVPMGVGYNLTGKSFTYYAQNGGTGDFEIGVSALYRSVWKASLMMTGFIGAPDRQPLADRDIIAFSVERTF